MRTLPFLFVPILFIACGQRPPAPAPAATTGAHEWADDTLWAVLQAQDHRDAAQLLHFLGHARPEVRERAAFAFASMPDPGARTALAAALHDSIARVRTAAALAIGNSRDSVLWLDLQRAQDAERDTAVLRTMLEQAFKLRMDLRARATPEELFQVLGSGNRAVRLRAAQQLARRAADGMNGLEPRVLEAARTERDPDVRMFLVAALEHFRTDQVRKALMERGASDSLTAIRIAALRALGVREDEELQGYFLDRMADGMQSVRLTAVEQLERMKGPLNAEEIWKVAQVQPDPFTQIPLYGLVLKHGGEGERLIARKLLEAQAALENMSYAEAAITRALAQDPGAEPAVLERILREAPTPVERSAAFEALLGALKERGAAADVAPVALYGDAMHQALSSGDAGLIALACEQLAQWTSADLQRALSPALEAGVRAALHPIRDLEALRSLETAVAQRDGKATPTFSAPSINHPIDRARLVALKDGKRYRIKTTKGDIVIELEPLAAPGSCVAFDSLATAGYYAGKSFHRIVPNFVAQGGCPRGDGFGSMDWTLRTEIGPDGFTKGAVGLASAGRDTESCQFFIMTAAAPHLDGRYTRFAHVVEGQDVADVLAVGDLILAVKQLP